jgi:hypothetical protein
MSPSPNPKRPSPKQMIQQPKEREIKIFKKQNDPTTQQKRIGNCL